MTRISAWTWSCAIVVALGVGVSSITAFLAESILWRPLGVHDQASLLRIGVAPISGPTALSSVSFPAFDELFARSNSLAGVAAWSTAGASHVPDGAPPENVQIELVTPNYFELVGVPIRHGRPLGPHREIVPAVVASARFARRHFDDAKAAVGRTIRLNDAVVTIVGIADAGFAGLDAGGPPDLFLEISQAPDVLPATFSPEALVSRSYNLLLVVARLAPGHTIDTVRAELDARAVHAPDSIDLATRGIGVFPAYPRVGSHAERLRSVARSAVVAGASVAALAILNFAALTLIRIERRSAEFTVRRVLGASRAAIAGLLLCDVVIVALFGFVFAALLAWTIVAALSNDAVIALRVAPDWMPAWPRALAIVAGITGCVTLAAIGLVGLAWRRTSGFRGGSRDVAVTHTARRGATPWLVVGQFAASLLLLYPAAIATQRIVELLRVDLGVSRLDARVLELAYDGTGNKSSFPARTEALLASIRQHPDVAHAALASMVPIGHRYIEYLATLRGGPNTGESVRFLLNQVSDDYFRAAGIRLVQGVDFGANEKRRVAIVSRAMAERHWPGSSPVGSTLDAPDGAYEIIGVAADAKYMDPFERPALVVYAPHTHALFSSFAALVVAPVPGAEEHLPMILRGQYATFSPSRSMAPVLTIGERLDEATASLRLAAHVLNVMAALTLGMAATSAYAALTQYVLQRRREIAVRKALGATSALLCRTLLLEALAMALVGLFAGAVIGGVLLHVHPIPSLGTFDPGAAAWVIAVALLSALVAGLGPARRAARVEPQVALRVER